VIHRIYSSLASFKEISFKPGLNVLLAQKEAGANDKQTRNRAGKTSLIEIVHFLTGAEAKPDSDFRREPLIGERFGMDFDLGGARTTVQRSGRDKAKVHIVGAGFAADRPYMSNADWAEALGKAMFGLGESTSPEGRSPKFRSLFAYFVRRQLNNAFTAPEKQATAQQTVDIQMALMFLLGLGLEDRQRLAEGSRSGKDAHRTQEGCRRRSIWQHNRESGRSSDQVDGDRG
jgi:uncharacterized protein YydD (DUF2326 family)